MGAGVVGRRLALIFLTLAAYPLAGWVGAAIPVNPPAPPPADGVALMVASNGVHTMLIVPVANQDADWRADFPASDLRAPQRPYTHLGIGWGDKQFYLETATWADVSWRTPVDVIAGGGESLLHADHMVNPAPHANRRVLVVSHAQYRGLVAAIRAQRAPGPRIAGYGDDDAFYPARETYTPWRTCNVWMGRILRDQGVRMGAWTPFAGGVMRWLPAQAG